MAFDSLPIVDASAVNSDISIIKMVSQLSQANGFICRPEQPDTGIDYEVELIVSANSASAWKFPVQLKSIAASFTKVDNGSMVSYSFPTSRLGYLMKRLPSMGLIVLYSVTDDLLLYDFVDQVFERLMEQRGKDDWKTNDNVNIHIPVANVLDAGTVNQVHTVFSQRFEQHALMQQSHGTKYRLPVGDITAKKFDPNSIEDVKRVLREHGPAMLNNYDIQFVYNLLVLMTHETVCADDELLIMAAVAYCEMGRHTESVLYANKLKRKDPVLYEKEANLKYVELKNGLSLGSIGPVDFVGRAKQLKSQLHGAVNQVTLAINILFFEILQVKGLHPIPEHLFQEVDSIFKSIEDSGADDKTKNLLKLWNADNYRLLAGRLRTRELGELRMRESMGGHFSMEERWQRLMFLMGLEDGFNAILADLDSYAKDTGNKLLQASIWALHNRHCISKEIDYYSFGAKKDVSEQYRSLMENNVALGMQAYHLFIQLDHYSDAYHVLCTTLELIDISRRIYGFSDTYDTDELVVIKARLETNFDLGPYGSTVDHLFANIKLGPSEGTGSLEFVKDMDDTEIGTVATIALNSYGLPLDRLPNIINEMKAYRLFHNRHTNGTLDIFQVLTGQGQPQMYTEPTRFVLRSRATGLQTQESTDMDGLLTSWGY